MRAEKAEAASRTENDPRRGASGIVVGVSGGADSLALAVSACDYAQRQGVPCVAVTVDHGLRPGSDAEAQAVRRQLTALGVSEATVLTASDVSGPRPTERRARDLRHKLLEEFAVRWAQEQELDQVDILLGHTMDDQAETVLMRLGRGASPRSLAAMRERTLVTDGAPAGRARRRDRRALGSMAEGASPDVRRPGHLDGAETSRVPVIFRGRPFLGLRRADTEAFCRALDLSWVEDPTNSLERTWTSADGRPLVRTALRHRVLPELAGALGQDPVLALARVAALLADDEAVLQAAAITALSEVRETPALLPSEDLVLGVRSLLVHPPAIRRRVYALALAELSPVSPAASQLQAVDALAANDISGHHSPIGKSVHVSGGIVVTRRRAGLAFRAARDAGGPQASRPPA